jgi:hypothetical protein
LIKGTCDTEVEVTRISIGSSVLAPFPSFGSDRNNKAAFKISLKRVVLWEIRPWSLKAV